MRPVLGVSLKIASAIVLTVMLVLIKIVGDRIPVGEIVFARTFFGMMPIVALSAIRGELADAFVTKRPFGHALRSVIGLTAMVSWFAALTMLPLPDATAITYCAPLITVIFAAIFLGETVRIYRWGAVVVGFVGVIIILSPHLSFGNVGDTTARNGAILSFVAAIGMAGAMTMVRKLTETERTGAIVLYFSATGALFSLATLPFGWVMPSTEDAILLVSIGLVGGIGQILLTQSYRLADASTIAPFDYTSIIWAMLLGWIVFGEAPEMPVYIGSAILVVAGLFVIYREHRLGLDSARARRATTPMRT